MQSERPTRLDIEIALLGSMIGKGNVPALINPRGSFVLRPNNGVEKCDDLIRRRLAAARAEKEKSTPLPGA